MTVVNLGEDTDTVAACAGGLAGILYGEQDIPRDWLSQLAKEDYIRELCEAFENFPFEDSPYGKVAVDGAVQDVGAVQDTVQDVLSTS